MREIKARAWDGVQYYYDIVPLFNSMEIILNHPLAGNKLHKVEAFEEFTTKKDSKRTKEYPKGQEIYEGDILYFASYFTTGIVEWHEKYLTWWVRLNRNAICEGKRMEGSLFNFCTSIGWGDSYEVIDNICENKLKVHA